jgi:hypothetical protein
MTEKQYRESHEEFIKRIDALDRQCPIDPPESPEEAKWNEKRINQVKQHIKWKNQSCIR